MFFLISDGSHKDYVASDLATAQNDLFIRYFHFTNDLDDCYFTPAASVAKMNREKGFTFYALNDEGGPEYSRQYYATITRLNTLDGLKDFDFI